MLALILTVVLATGPAVPGPCTALDAAGKAFPTCFDPGTGWLLGAGGVAAPGAATAEWRTALLLRTARESQSKATPWFNTHRLFVTEARRAPARRGLSATLYEGNLRRHLEEGFILVPAARPVRIPFPFDLTLSVRVGHYERRVWEGPGWTLETGRVALLVDPLRVPAARVWLGVGPLASHTLRHTPGRDEQTLSPFTTLLLDAGYETEEGTWVARLTALAGWTVGLDGAMRPHARAEASLERLVLAVNDQPLWVRLGATHVHADAGVFRASEWSLGLGVVLRVVGRRESRAPGTPARAKGR